MKLKEARIEAKLAQTDIVPLLKAVEPRADVGVLSRYENGVCVPTPAQFRILCEAYGKEPGDLYTLDEVEYGVKARAKKKDSHKEAGYRLFARVPQALVDDPEHFKAMLAACGYTSVVAWVCQCVKRLEAEYAARSKGKDRPDGATSKAANAK